MKYIKSKDSSDLRPKGSVERQCSNCKWSCWFDSLSKEATILPFVCNACIENPEIKATCSACNHGFTARHLDLCKMGYHLRCNSCKDIPPMQFAKEIHCWCCNCDSGLPQTEPCCGNATQEKRYPKHCDCEACWQTWYHVCDKHAADWIYDKTDEEQKSILRKRGAKIIELEDGWTFTWPQPPVQVDVNIGKEIKTSESN